MQAFLQVWPELRYAAVITAPDAGDAADDGIGQFPAGRRERRRQVVAFLFQRDYRTLVVGVIVAGRLRGRQLRRDVELQHLQIEIMHVLGSIAVGAFYAVSYQRAGVNQRDLPRHTRRVENIVRPQIQQGVAGGGENLLRRQQLPLHRPIIVIEL